MARKKLRLLDYETIINAFRSGSSAREIAAKGIAGRNKAREVREIAARLGWLDAQRPAPDAAQIVAELVREPPVPVRLSVLECCRAEIEAWNDRGYKPTQIFRKLKELQKFRPDLSSFSIGGVKRFARRLSPPNPECFVALQFEPGEAAQVDFGSGPTFRDPKTGKERKTHVFVMTLCYSRHMYTELVWNQSVETWLRCHQNAFQAFGGVPSRLTIDNLKAAITRASFNDPVVQKSYEAFARDWGFQIEPNRPRTPRHKGRVESGVKYVKSAVFCHEDPTFERTQQRLEEFVYGEAGHRIHGTTQRQPLEAFESEEKPRLQSLPDPLPEMVSWAWGRVDTTCHVYFNRSWYSVPHLYVGKTLLVKAGLKLVEIYNEEQRLAVHVRATVPGTYRTNLEHYPAEKRGPVEMTEQRCREQAQNIGPHTTEFVSGLLDDKCVRRLPAVRGVLRLVEKYEKPRLEAASKRALDYGITRYTDLKRMLERGLDHEVLEDETTRRAYLAFVPTARFGRAIGELMAETGS